MQRLWSVDELGERWSLLSEDLALLAGIRPSCEATPEGIGAQ